MKNEFNELIKALEEAAQNQPLGATIATLNIYPEYRHLFSSKVQEIFERACKNSSSS